MDKINNRRYTKKRRNKNGRVEAYDSTLNMWQLQDNIPYVYSTYINSLAFDENPTTPSSGRDYNFGNVVDGRESSYSGSSDYTTTNDTLSSSTYDTSSSYSTSSDSSSSSSSSFD